MINKENFTKILESLGFKKTKDMYIKKFTELHSELKVDIKNEKLIYPKALKVNGEFTLNFKDNENFVVFECVHKLMSQGYQPKHMELEPKWQLGHGASGGRADILIKDNDEKSLLIIECKTAGREFSSAWSNTLVKPTQLFSYVRQATSTKFIALYASDFIDEKVVSNYYLINLQDNEEILKKNDKLVAYKDATSTQELYRVWRDTYKQDYTTLGLFEDNKAYDIGFAQPKLEHLKQVTSNDIQSKYHEFATILRQHNVSGRENAFDKLVNLFLCKVTDEKENSDNLKFYYKGIAFDEPFDFQDRLQLLYKQGMDKFLDDDITYIDNSLIDEAFGVFKDKPNETKRLIKQYLKEQKFFTNNDFAFIDVHNEKLFYQNFEVLLKIARMIQDISLTASDENQFLGDMFEGFLDQGVKQSEGQFFTPMPIVKFIINSMPKLDKPQVIDYACGAGHFLNEYIVVNKEATITGVEKEYRLSKVAKVSSFMYGSDINIIYNDALSKSDKIKDNFYDVLVANPPYSVKGFLETLSDEERQSYELIKHIDEKSYSKNGSIECFFIERAKQLLKGTAIAGIVLPNSILSKDTPKLYIKTREIILKYFDIVAIADFGSGTFGKTGTNTATLFLKRKVLSPDISEHLNNMVNSWFDCDEESNKAFKDDELLKEYAKHINIDIRLYKTLLCKVFDEALFKNETFMEYQKDYAKLTKTKNRKKTQAYKKLEKKEQESIELKELLDYVHNIEKEKLYYFCLSFKNSTEVLIVKSPADSKENKKFLGYDWSNSKGKEGIQYLSNNTLEDETLSEEDKRVLENLSGLKNINTPLYNPHNKEDKNKINSLISKNFSGEKVEIPDELKKFVSSSRLVDMLDFSRKDFSKAISLNPKKETEIIGKPEWQVKLGSIVKIIAGQSPKSEFYNESKNGLPFYQGKKEFGTTFLNDPVVWTSKTTKVSIKNDLLMSVRAPVGTVNINQFDKICIGRGLAALRADNLITQKYLFEFCKMNENYFVGNTGAIFDSISSGDLSEIKIPLPPLDIQKEIIKECEAIDKELEKENKNIEAFRNEIENEVNSGSRGVSKVQLSDISKTISSGLTPLRSNSQFWNDGTIPWLKTEQLNEKYIFDTNEKISEIALEKTSIKINKKNTLSIAMYGEGRTRGSVAILKNEMTTNQACCNVYLDKNKAYYEYVYYYLTTQYDNLRTLSSGVRQNLNTTHIKNYKIPLPTIDTQKEIVQKISKIEDKISKSKVIVESASSKKQAVLRKYL